MIVKAIIEMPMGVRYKYESNGKGGLIVDRALHVSVPFNYGYVPKTLCGDGDPLDIFVVSLAPLLPLSKIKVKIMGAIVAKDNGQQDDKLIAYIEDDLWSGMPGQLHINEIKSYLSLYKKNFDIISEVGPIEAGDLYIEAKKAYEKNK